MNEPTWYLAKFSVKIAAAGVLLCLAAGCSESAPPRPTDVIQSAASGPVNARLPLPMAEGATPFIRPGMRQPQTEPADQAELAPDDPIIGVSIGSVHRAYSCMAMSTYDTKVINDLVDGVPVTVTFCDRTECARAFTAKDRADPLSVQLGGWSGKALMLLIDGRMFSQDSNEIPLEEVSVERSTWGEWKKLHPDGDVFTGRAAPAPPQTPAE